MGNTLSQAKKYQVICDYKQRTLGDLEVRVGQRVKIDPRRSDDGQGWAYATNLDTKEKGWVPTNHIAKEKSIQAERWDVNIWQAFYRSWLGSKLKQIVLLPKINFSENVSGDKRPERNFYLLIFTILILKKLVESWKIKRKEKNSQTSVREVLALNLKEIANVFGKFTYVRACPQKPDT